MELHHRIQSALNSQGPHADELVTLAWILFIGGALIFLIVVALTAYALFAPEKRRAWLSREAVIIGGGLIFPVLTLSALLVYTLIAAASIIERSELAAVRVEVIGEQWWWRVHYLDAQGRRDFTTANEIRIPAGRPVELSLKSADVIHSFWVPNLAGKLDMIPGRTNRLRIEAKQPGVFRGQCAEYCGGPHAKMAFYVIAEAPEHFEAWLKSQREPAAEAAVGASEQGRALFLSHCAACHTVRGTAAAGLRGPDLTHVGSRTSLAAATLPNNAGTLAAWIASSQHIKPENLMPSFDIFTGQELRAIAGYLEQLK